MAKEKKKYWFIIGFLLFVAYVFIAAQPIPMETILVSQWLSSLESNYPAAGNGSSGGQDQTGETVPEKSELLPFTLGNRFGYVGSDGRFRINQVRRGNISLSADHWAEYDALPESIRINDPRSGASSPPGLVIENPRGYPLFLDKRVFIIGNEQNSLTALDEKGTALWTYDFPAPLTCIDAAAGYVLAGTLDGTVMLLNSSGSLVFAPFEPGGSRLSVILGCALSADASRLAIISGIDDQRFLLLEGSGDSYKVIYHEFLSERDGFRRPVHIGFADNDGRVAFEREGGLGLYDINTRLSIKLPLDGEIKALDDTGGGHLLFVLTSPSAQRKKLVVIRFPGTIIMEAPFKSETFFLGREGSRIYLGGGMTLASFELEKK